MAGKMTAAFVTFSLIAFLSTFAVVESNPAIAPGYQPNDIQICVENCALCKKMYAQWFDGPFCAESCIELKGKFIPDCEDIKSIAPFLKKP